ncbi:MAG: hypothetical protein AW07_03080 [Candidatus Accumulibacter sp. SK-11]|nr:MAG: hypothetical protein AW07_03080 [Candidatus Accumulibacter sp. SK-11]
MKVATVQKFRAWLEGMPLSSAPHGPETVLPTRRSCSCSIRHGRGSANQPLSRLPMTSPTATVTATVRNTRTPAFQPQRRTPSPSRSAASGKENQSRCETHQNKPSSSGFAQP